MSSDLNNTSIMSDANSPWPASTRDGQARAAALNALQLDTQQTTSLIAYESGSEVLIISASENSGLSVAEQLPKSLHVSLLIPTDSEGQNDSDRMQIKGNVPVVSAKVEELNGHLGQFSLNIQTKNGIANLASYMGLGRKHFDLVLDLSQSAYLQSEIKPFGYYAPGNDEQALNSVIHELPEMVGKFEKPKFFDYNPDICAHGNRGINGCNRCLETCPTQAITSLGERIEVDPYLCQGLGVCATACPSGAITYVYPLAKDLLRSLYLALNQYREAGGERPRILFYGTEEPEQVVSDLAAKLPENVLPIAVGEVGSAGMDAWLTLLAYGADQILLLGTDAVAPSVRKEIQSQLAVAQAILMGMGYQSDCLSLIEYPLGLDDLGAGVGDPSIGNGQWQRASFAASKEKRTTLRMALDHLYQQAPDPKPIEVLPADAPFGEILVNKATCTLCMACVSVCPVAALQDGKDKPQLSFVEANCVQCGMCQTACPEDAIQLSPRMLYDWEERRQSRILNEEKPFECIACGKPFATHKVIDAMKDKLKDHWMFQDEKAMRRMQMCGDCRVNAMFYEEAGLTNPYDKTDGGIN